MGKKKDVDDRFKKFGTVSFTSISKVNDFISHLEDGKVMTTKCSNCGYMFFPPRSDCSQCMSNKMDWSEVRGNGKLITYSKLEFAPIGFQDDVPYCIALLDYGDYKIFGRIAKEVPEGDIKIGMEMTTAVNTLPNGQLNYVFHKA